MPYYNCCVSGCTNDFRNVGKLSRYAIFGILFIFVRQATRPSPLLDWEMANCYNYLRYIVKVIMIDNRYMHINNKYIRFIN